jgi:alpha-ketoglutarate-dependent taurine dioxygenase
MPDIFHCPTRTRFNASSAAISARIATHGYAVIQAWDAGPETLTEVSERFGRVQSHIRADASGRVGIAVETVVNREWEAHREEYHGVSSGEFLPHTDGSYLLGLVAREDGYLELLPPKMLMLQCWQTAASGGANLLLDGARVFADLARERPEDARILSTRGCVTFCRDDQIAIDCAVFQDLGDGTMMMRFRYDNTVFLADWAEDAFHALQRDYFSNPAYQSRIALTPGQILAIDNYRMLHGREAFTNDAGGAKRSMRRVWLAHDRLPVLRNALGERPKKRALQRFEAYDILPPSAAYATATAACVGIRKAA